MASTEASIPVVDLRHADAGDAIIEAYSTVGFAYLEGHGIADELIKTVFAESRRFHDLPVADKMGVELDDCHRGYIPIDTSTDRNSKLAEVTKPNQSESFIIMREDEPDGSEVESGAYLAGPNQWPSSLPGFRTALETYSAEMTNLGRRLVKLVADGLGDRDKTMAAAFATPTTWLRLLHYPPQPAASPEDLFGSAPHCDFGFLTILAQDEVGGLQVQTTEGEWVDVPPRPGAFIMNVGDMLHRWSNGRLLSTPHRVINRSGRERYSVPFFFDPHVNTLVSPLPSCVGDTDTEFADLVFGDFLRAELTAGYDAHSESSEAGRS